MNTYRLGLVIIFMLLSAMVSCRTGVSPSSVSVPLAGLDTARLGTITRDVTYGNADGVALKLDIYYPETASGALPVAVYVHGGAWIQGDKNEGAGVKEIPELLKRGFLVASINYRLAPQYKFPAQIEDVKCAVRFLRADAINYCLDPDRIGVWGGSAGGHLVDLLGTTDESAGLEGLGGYLDQSSRVQAVVDMFGPADLNLLFQGPQAAVAEQVFGTSDVGSQALRLASPVNYVSPDDPPFLIIHGDKDNVVPLKQSQVLYDSLSTAGVPVKLVIVKNGGYGFNPVGGDISPNRSKITEAIIDFFEKYLK